jgi:hypothetical protein
MISQQRAEVSCSIEIRGYGSAAVFLALGVLLVVPRAAAAQTGADSLPIGSVYTSTRLAFRYTPPLGMKDKTGRFRLQIQEQAKASGTTQTFSALLAMSSGANGDAPGWDSVTIETYRRSAVPELDDSKAEAQMSAWVAHSKDASALPRSVVISGQSFTVSVFGLQEGSVKKGAVVWTTVRKGKLLSFAFVANSPEKLMKLAETMKSVEFF